jgi:trimeric autotransporter adhesin
MESTWGASPRSAVLGALLGVAAVLAVAGPSEAAPGDATASQVADIRPGGESSPTELFNAGGTLLFSATDGTNGTELWKSNGGPLGPGGTEMVTNINGGSQSSNPGSFASIGGTVFFRADDGTSPSDHGRELWKLPAPFSTPVLVEDIAAGPTGSDPDHLTSVDGTLFYAADDGADGTELWKLEAPYADAVQVEDINAADGSFPDELTAVGDILFLIADDGDGYEVWKSEPPYSSGSTTMVKDIDPTGVGTPQELTEVGGALVFSADDGDGYELWRSAGPQFDATTTSKVDDINPTPGTGANLRDLTDINGTLFFEADDGLNGQELWKLAPPYTDAQIVEINPGPSASDPGELTNLGGTLYLEAHGASGGSELWRSDGGPLGAGTELVADINPVIGSGPAGLTTVAGQLFFGADSDGVNSRELWKSTGTGATKVADISVTADPLIQGLTDVNGTLFFSARDVAGNRELWKATIEPAPPPSAPPATPAQPAKKKKCKKKGKGKKTASSAKKKKKCKKKKKKKKKKTD